MIDDGRPPLTDVDAFGNFWHGYYANIGVWRNRAGASMPGFTAGTAANSKIAGTRFDAHLVDFSMPVVETPANETALGMERWNKAILHGANKYYAINSSLSFGVGGWPYRAPDGTVFHLMMVATYATPNTVQLRAARLTPSFAEPATVLAEIEVPYTSPVNDLNFSPDGSKAAAHSYNLTDYLGSFWDNSIFHWIVEAAISGGSAEVMPTATLALTQGDSFSIDGTIMVPLMKTVWTPDPVVYTNVTATTRTATRTSKATPVQAGGAGLDAGTATRPLYNGGTVYDSLVAVAYAPDGGRVELRTGNRTATRYSVPSMVSSVDRIETWEEVIGGGGGWVINGTVTTVQQGYSLWRQSVGPSSVLRLSRNGVVVSSIVADQETEYEGTIDPVFDAQNYQTISEGVIISGPTKTGNGYNTIGNSVFDSTLLRCTRFASNVVGAVLKTSTWGVLAWAGAVGNGEYSYQSTFDLTSSRFPAVHPETGAMASTIRMYF